MLRCEGFEMFEGIIKITPKNNVKPYEEKGVILYRPDTYCFYVNGHSFSADVVTIVKDDTPVDYDKYNRLVMFHSPDEGLHHSIYEGNVNQTIIKYELCTRKLIENIAIGYHVIYAIKTYKDEELEKIHVYANGYIVSDSSYESIVKANPNSIILSHEC